MSNEQLEVAIESAWENRDAITPATQGETREAIEATLNALDSGSLRVAQKLDDGSWHVNQWAKKAVLLVSRTWKFNLVAHKAVAGGIRLIANLLVGVKTNGRPQVSVRFQIALFANPHLLHLASY